MIYYKFIDSWKAYFGVRYSCVKLGVPVSSYEKWCNRGRVKHQERLEDIERQAGLVKRVFDDSRSTYGCRRIQVMLEQQKVFFSLKKIRRLMRYKNLVSHMETRQRKKMVTTISDSGNVYPLDLVRRRFLSSRLDEIYYGDITYLPYGYNKNMFLATVIDAHSKAVIGYKLDDHMRASLVTDALEQAIRMKNTSVSDPIIFHSDRGSQYRSNMFIELCETNNIKLSTGKTGICYDNAAAESFFSTLKIECPELGKRHMLNPTKIRVIVDEYINFYNNERLHSTGGYTTPQQKTLKAA